MGVPCVATWVCLKMGYTVYPQIDILDHFSRENMMIDHDKPFDLGSLVGFP